MVRRWAALLLVLLVAACEPEATPLPVNLPTLPATTSTSPAPDAQQLRYALAPDAAPYFPDEVKQQLGTNTTLVLLDTPPDPADLGRLYDIVVTFSDLPNAITVAGGLRVELAIHPSLGPTSDVTVYGVIQSVAAPSRIAELLSIPGTQAEPFANVDPIQMRVDLANAGYPDGLDITLAASPYAPGAQQVVQLLEAVGIMARLIDLPAATSNNTHLVLDTYYDHNDDFLDYSSLGAYIIPINYLAIPGLNVTGTGFPIISR